MPDSLALLLEMHPSRMSLNELVFAVLCYETPSPKPYEPGCHADVRDRRPDRGRRPRRGNDSI